MDREEGRGRKTPSFEGRDPRRCWRRGGGEQPRKAALRKGTVPGMATRYGASGRLPVRLRSPTDCEVQRGRFSTRPGAVIRSASGTNGVATIESDEGDEGGEQGEQRLHRDLLGLVSNRGSGDSALLASRRCHLATSDPAAGHRDALASSAGPVCLPVAALPSAKWVIRVGDSQWQRRPWRHRRAQRRLSLGERSIRTAHAWWRWRPTERGCRPVACAAVTRRGS